MYFTKKNIYIYIYIYGLFGQPTTFKYTKIWASPLWNLLVTEFFITSCLCPSGKSSPSLLHLWNSYPNFNSLYLSLRNISLHYHLIFCPTPPQHLQQCLDDVHAYGAVEMIHSFKYLWSVYLWQALNQSERWQKYRSYPPRIPRQA